jgi:hypothetical protein
MYTNHVYCQFLLAFAKTGKVPEDLKSYFQLESARSIRVMQTLREEQTGQGIAEHLSE